jgi:hypothetical protein
VPISSELHLPGTSPRTCTFLGSKVNRVHYLCIRPGRRPAAQAAWNIRTFHATQSVVIFPDRIGKTQAWPGNMGNGTRAHYPLRQSNEQDLDREQSRGEEERIEFPDAGRGER